MIVIDSTPISGNKRDLDGQREVPYNAAKEFANHFDMLDFVETSAKDNTHVDDAFLKMAKVRGYMYLV